LSRRHDVTICLSRFDGLHDPGKRLVRHWFEKSQRDSSTDYLVRFVFLWMSFNGWLSCVTECNRDSAMIESLCACRELRRDFTESMVGKSALGESVRSFAKEWPIRSTARNRRAKPEKWDPASWERPGWEDLNQCIYQVRCNLFHGNKASYVERDQHLVELAFRCLSTFIEASPIMRGVFMGTI
jgi:hypothetical protein